MGKEKQFENKVKDFLKSQNCWYIKYWGGSKFTKIGIPDLLCSVNGFFVAVELKAEKGKASDLQIYQIDEIRKSNGIAIILYPNQFEEFKELIISINKNMPLNRWASQFKFDRSY